ncbi:twin-arginine translocase subunit TatC [Ancrocorticia populi]|uniref:Sec-independent protein translocase protein TatC n=2 Tax=Ancrocorticia populi TaxID=2175228 RepID=A0A2V1KEM5_9ACTO|nr:twin-arginine translocase subunit TatC [Ancrocorticia populi]
MGVLDHLRELRKRLLWSLAGVLVGVIIGWFIFDPILGYLQGVLLDAAGRAGQLNFQTLGGALDLKFTVALWAGLILSSPWWIVQIATFIGPGLRKKERLFVAIFGTTGIILFAAGALAGVMVIPQAVHALIAFVPEGATTLLRADAFVSFCMKLILAFGVSFLIPEILVALNLVGALSVRSMLRGWKAAVVVCFTFAAMVNPVPSPIPMILQALALLALYFVAVGVSAVHESRLRRRNGITRPARSFRLTMNLRRRPKQLKDSPARASSS